jgi:hypothetical protein
MEVCGARLDPHCYLLAGIRSGVCRFFGHAPWLLEKLELHREPPQVKLDPQDVKASFIAGGAGPRFPPGGNACSR